MMRASSTTLDIDLTTPIISKIIIIIIIIITTTTKRTPTTTMSIDGINYNAGQGQ